MTTATAAKFHIGQRVQQIGRKGIPTAAVYTVREIHSGKDWHNGSVWYIAVREGCKTSKGLIREDSLVVAA